jgi:multisubunit Na+/H+ antiporter MnhB subunit
MYVWIWRHLPGNRLAKLGGCLVLLVGALALLFLVIFPRVESWAPFNHSTVDSPGHALGVLRR